MTHMPAGPWLLVIGCHRSGTSAVTGAMAALGLHGVDPSDRMERQSSNPEHWESLAAALFDEDLLVSLGAAWDAPPPPGADVPTTGIDADGREAAAIMANAYPLPGPVVWKDPRACLLLPYWRAILPTPLAAVFVWREPLAVARSLHTRDGIPLADGLALWERYNRSAGLGLGGIDTFVLDYASMVENPRASLSGVAKWLSELEQFTPHAGTWDLEAAVGAVDGGLAHESGRQVPADGTLPDALSGMVEWLGDIEGVHLPFDSVPPDPTSMWPEAVLAGRREQARLVRERDHLAAERTARATEYTAVRAIFESLLRNREVKLAESRAEVDSLGRQLDEVGLQLDAVRAKLDQIRTSTSWKVTRPLRSAIGKLSG